MLCFAKLGTLRRICMSPALCGSAKQRQGRHCLPAQPQLISCKLALPLLASSLLASLPCTSRCYISQDMLSPAPNPPLTHFLLPDPSSCALMPPVVCAAPAGPGTLVCLARGEFDRSALMARLAPAYAQLLQQLGALGVPEVQVCVLTKGRACVLNLCVCLRVSMERKRRGANEGRCTRTASWRKPHP